MDGLTGCPVFRKSRHTICPWGAVHLFHSGLATSCLLPPTSYSILSNGTSNEMRLTQHRSCMPLVSEVSLAINMVFTIYVGIRMPKSAQQEEESNPTRLSRCRQLVGVILNTIDDAKPPFFFREVRFFVLGLSLVFSLCRLVYEGVNLDIYVVPAAVRVLATILQILDHYWLCVNWAEFFVGQKLKAYLWFRLFLSLSSYIFANAIGGAYTSDWGSFTFNIVASIVIMGWYLWGKKWALTWGDMHGDRRICSIRYMLMSIAVLYCGLFIVDCLFSTFARALLPLYAVIVFSLVSAVFYYVEVRHMRIATNESNSTKALNSHMLSRGPESSLHLKESLSLRVRGELRRAVSQSFSMRRSSSVQLPRKVAVVPDDANEGREGGLDRGEGRGGPIAEAARDGASTNYDGPWEPGTVQFCALVAVAAQGDIAESCSGLAPSHQLQPPVMSQTQSQSLLVPQSLAPETEAAVAAGLGGLGRPLLVEHKQHEPDHTHEHVDVEASLRVSMERYVLVWFDVMGSDVPRY